MRMSALLNSNNYQSSPVQMPQFSSCFPTKKDKDNPTNQDNYVKITKSISQFDTDQVVKESSD